MNLSNMTGRLYKILKKKNQRSPDYSGEIRIDGVNYRVLAWFVPESKLRKGRWDLRILEDDSQENHTADMFPEEKKHHEDLGDTEGSTSADQAGANCRQILEFLNK